MDSGLPGGFAVAGGELLIGGTPVTLVAERAGSTPFFAYDRELLDRRVSLLRSHLTGIHLSYAIKANPMPAVVQHLSNRVDGFDVTSSSELRTALDTGIDPGVVSFAGPGKSKSELRQAVAAGVMVELESATELERLIEAGDALGLTPVCAIRVNPEFAVKGSGMRMGGGPQQFGIDSESVPALLKDVARAGLDFRGFHVFAGSQNLHADVIVEAQRRTVELVLRLADSAPTPISYLNLGGGFGIPYSDRDRPLELEVVGDGMRALLDEVVVPRLGTIRTVIELGRFIVGEAGVYVTRVHDRKESRGHTFLVVDGGMHHQLAASGNLGQKIRRNYPLAIANRMDEERSEAVSVVGVLCTPLDLLGDNVRLPRAEIGDLVAVFQAGAYGLTASPLEFLSHPRPVEMLV